MVNNDIIQKRFLEFKKDLVKKPVKQTSLGDFSEVPTLFPAPVKENPSAPASVPAQAPRTNEPTQSTEQSLNPKEIDEYLRGLKVAEHEKKLSEQAANDINRKVATDVPTDKIPDVIGEEGVSSDKTQKVIEDRWKEAKEKETFTPRNLVNRISDKTNRDFDAVLPLANKAFTTAIGIAGSLNLNDFDKTPKEIWLRDDKGQKVNAEVTRVPSGLKITLDKKTKMKPTGQASLSSSTFIVPMGLDSAGNSKVNTKKLENMISEFEEFGSAVGEDIRNNLTFSEILTLMNDNADLVAARKFPKFSYAPSPEAKEEQAVGRIQEKGSAEQQAQRLREEAKIKEAERVSGLKKPLKADRFEAERVKDLNDKKEGFTLKDKKSRGEPLSPEEEVKLAAFMSKQEEGSRKLAEDQTKKDFEEQRLAAEREKSIGESKKDMALKEQRLNAKSKIENKIKNKEPLSPEDRKFIADWNERARQNKAKKQ